MWLNLNGTIIFFFLSKVSEWRSIEQNDCLECMTFYGRRQTSSLPSYRHDIIFQMNAVTMMLQSSVWGKSMNVKSKSLRGKTCSITDVTWSFFVCPPRLLWVLSFSWVSREKISPAAEILALRGPGLIRIDASTFPFPMWHLNTLKGIPTSCGRLAGGDVPNHLHACCYRQVFIYLLQLTACSFHSWASRTDVLNEHSLPPPKR